MTQIEFEALPQEQRAKLIQLQNRSSMSWEHFLARIDPIEHSSSVCIHVLGRTYVIDTLGYVS